MPTTKTTARTAATRGITLTFDPRYLEWVVQFWLARDLAPAKLDDFTSGAITHAKEQLAELNTMGLREEEASTDAVAKAIRLLQDLGLLQKKKVPSHPPKLPRSKRGSSQSPTETFVSSSVEAPYYELAVTADGREMLTQPVAMGGLRLELVRRVVTRSPDLTAFLTALDTGGPLITPIRSLTPLAPTRGAAYNRAVDEGVEAFWIQIMRQEVPASANGASAKSVRRPAAGKLIENAAALALKGYPASTMKQAGKLMPLAAALGLVWTDTRPINEVIAAHYLGSSATRDRDGFVPRTPSWDSAKSRVVEELIRVWRTRADSTGFATVAALRGALSSALHVSSPVADALLRSARAAGDRKEILISLHFEPDEDLMYSEARQPLLWNGRAYDLVLLSMKP